MSNSREERRPKMSTVRAGRGREKAVRSLREEQKLLTKRKLVDAARDVFSEQGYSATTVDDIITRAGASRGTFYLYFSTKAEVADELLSEYVAATEVLVDELQGLAEQVRRGHRLTRRELEVWISSFFKVFSEHGACIDVWEQAEGAQDTRVEGRMKRLVDSFSELVTAARADIAADDPREIRIRTLLLLSQIER